MRLDSLRREPLLHFLLLGLALFLLYGLVAPRSDGDRRIVVTRAQVDDLSRQYATTFNRPPTSEELSTLVDNHVRDEIQYREGLALGLDRDDPLIKRRIRQKLEVMAEESLARDAATDDELEAYLRANPEAFREPAVIGFEQLFFAAPGAAIETARRALARGADTVTLGEPTLLPRRVQDQPLDFVARDFGERFAQQLEALPIGQWAGPVASDFGLHLVRVAQFTPAVVPPLGAVRPKVAREWENARRQRALDENHRRLLQEYEVVIEAPSARAAVR